MEEFIKKIIKEAGALSLEYFNKGIQDYEHKKDPDDVVTEADKAVSDFLVKEISAKYPTHHIASEEMSQDINAGAEYKWTIDPIDGTRNFAAGIPFYCVIIAVQKNGQTEFGAVYSPFGDQLYFAGKGRGATLNDMKIKVGQKTEIDFGFGFVSRSFRRTYTKEFAAVASWILQNTKGRAANFNCMLEVCYIARGTADFLFMNGGYNHDYLAPVLLAQEAGALVTDMTGQAWQPGQNDLVIANPTLHAKIIALFKKVGS